MATSDPLFREGNFAMRWSPRSSRHLRPSRLLFLVLVAGLIFGVGFLLTWEIAPPTATIERVIPDERFPR